MQQQGLDPKLATHSQTPPAKFNLGVYPLHHMEENFNSFNANMPLFLYHY